MSVRKYPLTKATHVSLESLTPVLSVSQFCRRSSRQEATLLVWGDIFSLGGTTFSGPNDPEALSHLLESLRNDTKKTWRQIRGQCSCLYVTPEKIEIFRSAFSPHMLFFTKHAVSDQLRMLATSGSSFSEEYVEAFVLDFPSLQFSSSRTPLKNVFRLPPSTLVTLTRHSAPTEELFPKESYQLVENNLSLEDAASQLKETLQNILQWHLAKGKTVATELSGGLDSSFVASFLADLSPKPIEALMYAYRKHPSHKFSEECAQIVARKKQINLRVFDSSEVPSVNLAEAAPYQNEPVDFFWQGALFGPICREFVKPDSLLITGFGCDQILMRNNQVLQLLARKKGIVASLPWVREVARSVNRPAANFTLQFLISRMPPGFLVRLLDSTRRMKINPFKIDELLPEVTRTDRVDWFIKEGKPLSSALLWNLTQAEKHWESRVFEADLPHSNLNYLVAPQYVIQPYLEFQGVEYVHPFCDFRMIDFVYTQIPFQFIHDFSRPYKNLLRQAMLNITPEEVRNRKRDEFSFDGYFFSVLKANEELLRDFLRSACDDFSDWIDRRGIFRSFESMLFGVFSNSETKLARLLSYLVWKHHFKNTLPSDQRTVQ